MLRGVGSGCEMVSGGVETRFYSRITPETLKLKAFLFLNPGLNH